MKEYIVATLDGFTSDCNYSEKENMQILDFIFAKDFEEARKKACAKNYGVYTNFIIYEIKREIR